MNGFSRNSSQTWAGLLIEAPGRASEENVLREILGHEAVLLLVRGTDSAIEAVRKIVRSRALSLLAMMGDGEAPALTPLLNIASSLSSLRRIVVLHGATAEPSNALLARGILMIRDCPEVRSALGAIVARETEKSRVPVPEERALRGLEFAACVQMHESEAPRAGVDCTSPPIGGGRVGSHRSDEPPWHYRSVPA